MHIRGVVGGKLKMDRSMVNEYRSLLINLTNESFQGERIFSDVAYSFIRNINDRRLDGIRIFSDINIPMIVACKPGCMAESDNEISQIDASPKSYPVSRRSQRDFSSNNSMGRFVGSPLKMEEYADLSDVESQSPFLDTKCFKSSPTNCGISYMQAKVVSSLYSLAFSNEASTAPLLILCDGKDRNLTACMILVQNGPCLKTSVLSMKCPEKKNKHYPNLNELNTKDGQMKYKAHYDMMGKMLQEIGNQEEFRGSLMVEIDWNKPICTGVLQQPPLESQAHIQAHVVSGDVRSTAYMYYRELQILGSFINGLETGEILWLADESDVSVNKQIKTLIEKLKLGDAAHRDKEAVQNELSEALGLDSLVFEHRNDLDFTDHLWNILIQCSSYKELEEAMKYVFSVLSNGDFYPMVHRKNNTVVAQMVREACAGKLRMPNLAGGTYAIQLLAEIGLEKLRQDYIHAFLSKELVVLGNIESFISTDGSFSARFACLQKLHNVIEMAVMLKLFLKLSLQTLNFAAMQMLKHYENNEISSNYRFDFPIPTSHVKSMIENCPPCLWQMDCEKKVQDVKEILKIILTRDNPFSHIEWRSSTDTPDEDVTDGLYYVIKLEDRVIFI